MVNQWAGITIMGLSLAARALDWVVIDAEGPPGFFTIGGDHCFGVYKITQTNIPNCTNRPAIACARIDPRQLTLPGFAVAATMGALAACLPNGVFGDHLVYLGFDRATGDLRYVGETNNIFERQQAHDRNGRDFRLVQITGGWSQEVAMVIESLVMTDLTLSGYRNLENDVVSYNAERPCFAIIAGYVLTLYVPLIKPHLDAALLLESLRQRWR